MVFHFLHLFSEGKVSPVLSELLHFRLDKLAEEVDLYIYVKGEPKQLHMKFAENGDKLLEFNIIDQEGP